MGLSGVFDRMNVVSKGSFHGQIKAQIIGIEYGPITWL